MKKRLHYWLILILVILVALAQPTKAQAVTVNSGTLGKNITWVLDSNGTMTISGIGDISAHWKLEEEDRRLWQSVEDTIKTVIIKDGVTSIGHSAFASCSNLINIYIPDSVTHIDHWAFRSCSNLSSITIPKNVTSIDLLAFDGCSSLDGFWVDKANPNYSNDQYGVLFNKDKTKLLKAPHALTGNYTVPDGVTTLGTLSDGDAPYCTAFSSCSKLTSITLPNSVTVIDEAAFAHCNSLTKVNIPNGVKEIRYITFMDCTSLTSITIPDNVTDIGNYVFSGCSDLTQITLGKGIQEIWANAFWGCSNLWHVLYTGTESEWNNINSNPQRYGDFTGNEALLSAIRHYNCTGTEVFDLANKKCSICLANCNHSWDSGKVTKEATCKEDGVKTYTCTICQKTKTEMVAKLTTHTPGAEATATTPQTCTVCGKELMPTISTTLPTTVPPTTVPPTAAPPTTVPPTTVPPTTEPLATELVTTPTTSETAETTVTPTQPIEAKKPDNSVSPVAAAVVIVVLAGGGTTAGIIFWKKKH